MTYRAILALAVLVSCNPEADDTAVSGPTRRMVRATRVSTTNAEELLLVGVRADGRVGDYALTNGSLSAVIDAAGFDERTGGELQLHRAPSGGTLVDLAAPGGHDALPQVLQLVGFDPDLRVLYQDVTVEQDGKEIHAVGRILDPDRKVGVALDDHDLVEQLVVSTTWRMWDRQPWIEVETVVANQTGRSVELDPIVDLFVTDGIGAAPFLPAPGIGYGLEDGEAVLTPWLVLDADPALPGAFAVLSLDSENLTVMPDMDIDGRVRGVLVGLEDTAKDAIASGEQRSWTRRYTASMGDDMTGVVCNVLELLGVQGGSYHLELGISEGSTVQLEFDEPRPARATFHRLEPARYVDDQGNIRDGGVMPLSTALVSASDPYLISWLSLGRYAVEIESAGYRGEPIEIDVQNGLEEYGLITLGPEPLTDISLSLRDPAGEGNSAPVRLTVVGLGGTPDPELGRFELAGDALAAGRRVWTNAAELSLRLPDGAYRFLVSRGPLHPIASAELRVPFDTAAELVLEGPEISAAGWVQADPFTASRASIFGGDDAEDIAFALCAEGLEFAVRAEAGGGGDALPGCEGQQVVTGAVAPMDVPRIGAPAGDGWWVSFPVEGELPTAGMRPGTWLDLAWESGAQVTAVLAPRARGAAGSGSGMFHARGFERDRIDDGEANRFLREASELGTYAVDVGGVEILTPRDPWHTTNVLKDWFALLSDGHQLYPVAASHSSWLSLDQPGAARTVILSGSDVLEDRLTAFAEGRTFVTSGPMLDVVARSSSEQAGPGETLHVPAGTRLELEIHLQAAAWVPVDRVRVFHNGQEVWSAQLEEDGGVDLLQTVQIETAGGGWLVVDAGRTDVQPDGDYALLYPNMPVFAVTAPIYLDTSGQ